MPWRITALLCLCVSWGCYADNSVEGQMRSVTGKGIRERLELLLSRHETSLNGLMSSLTAADVPLDSSLSIDRIIRQLMSRCDAFPSHVLHGVSTAPPGSAYYTVQCSPVGKEGFMNINNKAGRLVTVLPPNGDKMETYILEVPPGGVQFAWPDYGSDSIENPPPGKPWLSVAIPSANPTLEGKWTLPVISTSGDMSATLAKPRCALGLSSLAPSAFDSNSCPRYRGMMTVDVYLNRIDLSSEPIGSGVTFVAVKSADVGSELFLLATSDPNAPAVKNNAFVTVRGSSNKLIAATTAVQLGGGSAVQHMVVEGRNYTVAVREISPSNGTAFTGSWYSVAVLNNTYEDPFTAFRTTVSQAAKRVWIEMIGTAKWALGAMKLAFEGVSFSKQNNDDVRNTNLAVLTLWEMCDAYPSHNAHYASGPDGAFYFVFCKKYLHEGKYVRTVSVLHSRDNERYWYRLDSPPTTKSYGEPYQNASYDPLGRSWHLAGNPIANPSHSAVMGEITNLATTHRPGLIATEPRCGFWGPATRYDTDQCKRFKGMVATDFDVMNHTSAFIQRVMGEGHIGANSALFVINIFTYQNGTTNESLIGASRGCSDGRCDVQSDALLDAAVRDIKQNGGYTEGSRRVSLLGEDTVIDVVRFSHEGVNRTEWAICFVFRVRDYGLTPRTASPTPAPTAPTPPSSRTLTLTLPPTPAPTPTPTSTSEVIDPLKGLARGVVWSTSILMTNLISTGSSALAWTAMSLSSRGIDLMERSATDDMIRLQFELCDNFPHKAHSFFATGGDFYTTSCEHHSTTKSGRMVTVQHGNSSNPVRSYFLNVAPGSSGGAKYEYDRYGGVAMEQPRPDIANQPWHKNRTDQGAEDRITTTFVFPTGNIPPNPRTALNGHLLLRAALPACSPDLQIPETAFDVERVCPRFQGMLFTDMNATEIGTELSGYSASHTDVFAVVVNQLGHFMGSSDGMENVKAVNESGVIRYEPVLPTEVSSRKVKDLWNLYQNRGYGRDKVEGLINGVQSTVTWTAYSPDPTRITFQPAGSWTVVYGMTKTSFTDEPVQDLLMALTTYMHNQLSNLLHEALTASLSASEALTESGVDPSRSSHTDRVIKVLHDLCLHYNDHLAHSASSFNDYYYSVQCQPVDNLTRVFVKHETKLEEYHLDLSQAKWPNYGEPRETQPWSVLELPWHSSAIPKNNPQLAGALHFSGGSNNSTVTKLVKPRCSQSGPATPFDTAPSTPAPTTAGGTPAPPSSNLQCRRFQGMMVIDYNIAARASQKLRNITELGPAGRAFIMTQKGILLGSSVEGTEHGHVLDAKDDTIRIVAKKMKDAEIWREDGMEDRIKPFNIDLDGTSDRRTVYYQEYTAPSGFNMPDTIYTFLVLRSGDFQAPYPPPPKRPHLDDAAPAVLRISSFILAVILAVFTVI